MIKIGITGGIGSGKSVVSELLRLNGIPIYTADTESKKLMNTSSFIREELIKLFGSDIYSTRGLNKKLLASYIFNDVKFLSKVNSIVHPEVYHDFEKWAANQHFLCGIESAILFESGFNSLVDLSLMVYAPESLRIERAIARDKSNEEAVMRRIKNQIPDEKKISRCDHIIFNDNKQALIPQLDTFIKNIKRKDNLF